MNKIADIKKYKPRIMDQVVRKYLSIFGCILIEGPKRCGKTWISSFHAKSELLLDDPSNGFQNRELAKTSVATILNGKNPRLIDEWQEAPEIWDAVRYEIDRKGEPGLFILTGSSTPKNILTMHSGIGRIARLRLRTMSLFESGDSSGDISLKELCYGRMPQKYIGEVELMNLAQLIVRGGFPGVIGKPIEESILVNKSYIENIINVDTKKIEGRSYNKRKISLLLKSLARNESTTVSNRKLMNDIKEEDNDTIDYDTLTSYLDIFDRLFLFDNQLPFSSNVRSSIRIKQKEKRHFFDPSIACALLGLTPEKMINDLKTFGFLFEALCERDLKIYAESFEAKVYHYQDYEGNEIDAVIELENGKWCAFEIKLGAHQIDEAANNLIKISKKIEEEGFVPPSILCVICGMTRASYLRDDGVFVIPITALKN